MALKFISRQFRFVSLQQTYTIVVMESVQANRFIIMISIRNKNNDNNNSTFLFSGLSYG